MVDKLTLDLALAFPAPPDERARRVGRWTELLEAEGLEMAHLVRKDAAAHLCLHYDPERFNVSQLRSPVHGVDTRIANLYQHESLHIDGMDRPACAAPIREGLSPPAD